MPDPYLIAFATAVLLLAGTVKGLIGLGMPTVALTLLTLQTDARTAVTLIILPMLLSNIWQFWRGPDMVGCVKRHWRYSVILILCVAATVWFTQSAPDKFLRAVLGIFVLVFCFSSWRNLVPPIPSHRVRLFEGISAVIAGLVGGLTAAWAPPLAMYLRLFVHSYAHRVFTGRAFAAQNEPRAVQEAILGRVRNPRLQPAIGNPFGLILIGCRLRIQASGIVDGIHQSRPRGVSTYSGQRKWIGGS